MNLHEFVKLDVEHFTFHLQSKHSGTYANRSINKRTVMNSSNANILYVES